MKLTKREIILMIYVAFAVALAFMCIFQWASIKGYLTS